jgi:hypothetical protein
MAERLGGEVRGGEVRCPGPGHSADDRSLCVKPAKDAEAGFVCHSFSGDELNACKDYVRQRLRLPAFEPKQSSKKNGSGGKAWQTLAEHVYKQADGTPYLRVDRCRDQSGKKEFFQKHWDGKRWIKGKPKGAKVPYRLPEMIAAPLTTTVYICEGEKDADNLAKLGLVATTNSEGALNWSDDLNEHFKGRRVVILADADATGRKRVQHIARTLDPIAETVKIVDLYPDRTDGADVSDWLKSDSAAVKLLGIVRSTPAWEPTAAPVQSDEELISELAALDRLQYAKRRKEAAEALGITVGELDKIVAEARGDAEPPPTPMLCDHWIVEPSPEPVGDEVLSITVDILKRYVVMADEQALAVALWVMMTWVHAEAATHSPILLVTSVAPDSGKTTLLGVVSFLARRGLSSVSFTGPALFRTIQKWEPSIVIDEAENAFRKNPDLREVVNAGWTRGSIIVRCHSETHEPEPFSPFCPKAIGMIGRKLPPSTLGRSFVIAMRPKQPDQHVDDFDHTDNADFARLRSQLARWAADHAEALKVAAPEIPAGFHNRVRANWRLPLALAERCGWKEAAHKAAKEIEQLSAASDPEISVQLLADIRAAFGRLGADKLTTKSLIAELCSDEEAPWLSFGMSGKEITDRQLAKLLKDFRRGLGIKSRKLRVEGIAEPLRGYRKADFEDDFATYLPPSAQDTPFPSGTVEQVSNINDLFGNLSGTSTPHVPDNFSCNALENNTCSTVPDKNTPSQGRAHEPLLGEPKKPCGDSMPDEDRSCRHCDGAADGSEELCAIGGDLVWLHRECQRSYRPEKPQ